MQLLTTLWSALWPTLAITAALAAMLFVALLVNLHYAVFTDPERMSAVDGGASNSPDGGCKPPAPWPAKHFVCACMHCHHVTRSEGQPVRVGDELRVSHGICPACLKAWEEEAARLTSAATTVPTA